MQSQSDRDARIRDRAYQIWDREGRRHGRHDAHWQQAQREIEAEEGSGKNAPAHSKKPPVTTSEASPPTESRARAKGEPAAKKPRTRAAAAVASADSPATAPRAGSASPRPDTSKT